MRYRYFATSIGENVQKVMIDQGGRDVDADVEGGNVSKTDELGILYIRKHRTRHPILHTVECPHNISEMSCSEKWSMPTAKA